MHWQDAVSEAEEQDLKRALHDRGMALITFYLDVKILDIRYELVAFWKSKYILYNAGIHLIAIIYEQKSLKLCRICLLSLHPFIICLLLLTT